MSKSMLSLAALAALTLSAQAQAPANPPAAAAPPSADAKSASQAPADAKSAPQAPTDAKSAPQAKATPSPSGAAAQAKPAGSDTATEWTYKTKDGQMYQPPEQRPDSPAMETKTYGRT